MVSIKSDSFRKVPSLARTIVVGVLGVVFLALGVLNIAAPHALSLQGGASDGATIRNVMYGVVFTAAGVLLMAYALLAAVRAKRAGEDKVAGRDGAEQDSAAVTPAELATVGPAAGREDRAGADARGRRTVQEAAAEAEEMGGEVVDSGRIIRIPRTALDDQLEGTFAHGCAWLDAGELRDEALPVALLIPSREELFDYIASHYPPRTVMMCDHLAQGSGLPYFVNNGVHLHCAMVKNPQDMDRMLSTYNPDFPLACALVSGAMNLDSHSSEDAQMSTIRHSVIGLVCWHEARGEYLLISPC